MYAALDGVAPGVGTACMDYIHAWDTPAPWPGPTVYLSGLPEGVYEVVVFCMEGYGTDLQNDVKLNEAVWHATERILDMGVASDRLGYDSFWLTEHHFQYEGYEVVPNGLMTGVALAERTNHIRIGTMFNIVGQWHPLRLAEDFATLHNLSKGRGILGIGRGTVPREAEAINFLDPMVDSPRGDTTHARWRAADPDDPQTQDANVATIEVSTTGPGACAPLTGVFNPTFGVDVCVSIDDDGDPSVNILSFCTTPDCVDRINNNPGDQSQWRHAANPFQGTGTVAAAVPFSAATDGRDHWLSPGEPHCADCHKAPYVEQSGNINAFAPFNYPAKAALMRYSRGHRDITCQGCHESIHGLYPVTPNIDTTTYAQAASMNSDDSHGPLKCGACHEVNSRGVHERMDDLVYDGRRVRSDFDAAVGWAHTFTEEKSPLDNMCVNCHGDERDEVRPRDEKWQEHAMEGRASRPMMDQVEIELLGAIAGTNPATGEGDANIARNGVCQACHGDEFREVSCSGEDGREWKRHLSEGRVAETVWVAVSEDRTGGTCGW